MKDFKIKDCFICNFCREICKGPCDNLKRRIDSGELKYGDTEYDSDMSTDRKQIIGCLGKYCDRPCRLNKSDAYKDISVEVYIRAIKFLGNKCNSLIEKNNIMNEKSQMKAEF